MPKFKYHSLHIPSGQQFEKEIECVNAADFLKQLNSWNLCGGVTWKYWFVNGNATRSNVDSGIDPYSNVQLWLHQRGAITP